MKPFLYLILAVVLALGAWLIERPDRQPDAATALRQPFGPLDPVQVARIEVERLLDGIELRRDGAQWSVRPIATALRSQMHENAQKRDRSLPICMDRASDGTCPSSIADAAKVTDALGALQRMTTTSLVSTNPAQQARYQVNQLALQVRAYDAAGTLVAHVHVGKQAPDFFSTYVRRAGEDRVYLTREGLAVHFPTAIEHWQPKVVRRPPWLAGLKSDD